MVSSCIYSLRYISVTGRAPLVAEIRLIAPITQIYVQLFDNPSRAREILSTGKRSVSDSPDKTMSCLSGLSAEEEKKAKKRAKKAQQKQEEQRKGVDRIAKQWWSSLKPCGSGSSINK